ncbi:dipeptidase [Flexibacterium corallicola]|uniref:dipeptidase n=1 Tax=Flexibacterium corallicola TaxID=3037259 RepID=UPI00286EDF0E|nr:dipeptidase [Pseudovibrio sp. M1P-2-3]
MGVSYWKVIGGAVIATAILGIVAVNSGGVAQYIDRQQNKTLAHAPYQISPQAQKLHQSLRIADLHNDALLWDRHLSKHQSYGHTDLPRLNLGNVALQVFTSVTKSPAGQNYEKNKQGARDRITLLGWAQNWPKRAREQLSERALLQARRLYQLEQNHPDELKVVHTRQELQTVLKLRQEGGRQIAGILGTEGGHALDGSLDNLDVLFAGGVRVMGLQHFFDNALGGSLHGQNKAGLTDFGKQVVRLVEEKEMIIDVAHSSPAVIDDVLNMTNRPIIVSHTGVKGICDTPRNLSTRQVKEIAAKGGLIGIGFWGAAVCDTSPLGVAKSIDYAVSLAGIDHVALGSDFDGAVTTALDTSELAAITQALISLNYTDQQIAAIMGENTIKFMLNALPQN